MELFKSGDFTTSGFVGIPIFQTGFSNPSFQFPRNGPATPVAQKPWSSRLVSDINGGNVTVPDGQYQLLLKILRPFGNPNNRNDFVTWKSPIIEIIDPSNTSVSNQTTTQTTTKTGVSTKNQWRG
ncbi:hypothetical protein RclHR1_03130012 [Rhizophagus clarus]|nr:hypothetical protein RclHR1_03130012 [Rhizophagus clarus]